MPRNPVANSALALAWAETSSAMACLCQSTVVASVVSEVTFCEIILVLRAEVSLSLMSMKSDGQG